MLARSLFRTTTSFSLSHLSLTSLSLNNYSTLTKMKKRQTMKEETRRERETIPMKCVAFRTAESYDFQVLQKKLSFSSFSPTIFPDVIHINPSQTRGDDRTPKSVFFFRGAVVCWGTDLAEEQTILETTKEAHVHPLPSLLSEEMDCFLTEGSHTHTRISGHGEIYLKVDQLESDLIQEQLAFSYALVSSLELEQYEGMLDSILAQVEPILNDILNAPPTPRQCREILSKEIDLRRKINLKSNLMDTPDIYWEEPQLEKLLEKTRDCLDVSRRFGRLNFSLQHVHDMIAIFKSEHESSSSHLLEVLIVLLIFVEIVCTLAEKSERWRQFRFEHLFEKKEKKEKE